MALSAALVLVGLISLLNLLLTLGLVRRMRELESRPAATAPRPSGFVAGPGTAVGPRATVDVTGRPVPLPDPASLTVIGFFATDCPSCADSMPGFLTRAAGAGPDRAIAVVTGARDDEDRYVRRLAPTVPVVADQAADELAAAFRVRAYPAFVLLGPDGTVRASGLSLDDLPVTVPA